MRIPYLLIVFSLGSYAFADPVSLIGSEDARMHSMRVSVRTEIKRNSAEDKFEATLQNNIVFKGSDRVVETELAWQNGESKPSKTLVDLQQDAIIRVQSVTSVEPRASFRPNTDPMQGPVALGPSYALGRGVSKWKDLSFQKDGTKVIARGKSGGSQWRATLRPEYGWIAEEVIRFTADGKTVWAKWSTSKFKQDRKGFWYPGKSTATLGADPTDAQIQTSTIESLETIPVAPTEFERDWYAPNTDVADHRVEPAVGYSAAEIEAFKKDGPLTLDRLLTISKSRAAKYAKAEEHRPDAHPGTDPRIEMLKVVAGVFLVIGTAFLWQRKRKP